MLSVLAPVTGTVWPLGAVPDPVFAAEMVGAGAAINPLGNPPGPALSPISGNLMKVLPHAFVVSGESLDVLVHLGLDTLRLKGEGFEVIAEEGQDILAGSPVVHWNPALVAERDLSPVVLVCVLGTPPGYVNAGLSGRPVVAGAHLFDLPEL